MKFIPFIVGCSVLVFGTWLFLEVFSPYMEPLSSMPWQKCIGILLSAVGVYLLILVKSSNTPRAFTSSERADEYQATAHDEKQGIDTSAGASNSGGRHDS